MQHTLINSVLFNGIGLHSGAPITMTVSPAMANEGIRFIRKDITDKDNVIPARWDLVEASQLCTRLRNDAGVDVSTVEHIMAALAGMGIDNATIILDGPEVPIMDGSSMPFVEKFKQVGVETLNTKRQSIKILKTIEVEDENGAIAKLEADTQSVFEFTIDFPNKFIGRQSLEFALTNNTVFETELANCPTFTTRDVIDYLRSQGLIKGGSIENADVYDDDMVHRDEAKGERQADAAVRHKLLDAVGDCALAGAPIIGRYISEKGGHMLTNKLLRELFSDPTNYAMIEDGLDIVAVTNMSASPKVAYNA